MQVSGVDHVNIITDDVDSTAAFYQDLLGLRRGESAGAKMGFKGAWMHDAQGNAIVHISWNDPARDMGGDHIIGGTTGAVHHVAFRCKGFDAMRQHLGKLGIEHRVMERPDFAFRQITLRDPNNINLELNFAGD